MKTKPNMIFVICAAVSALLIAGAAVLVVFGFRGLAVTEGKLANKKMELSAFYKRQPFPSLDNVARERANVVELDNWFSNLVSRASQGQLQLEQRSPSTFMALLGQKKRQLVAESKDKIELPEAFAFGFDRYFASGSELPSPEHVPRLTQQLVIIEGLFRILYGEGATSVRSITRQIFEGADPNAKRNTVASAPADAGLVPEDGLYARLNFRLDFTATERALLGVLNRIAADDLFWVVTRVDVVKAGPDVVIPDLQRPARGSEREPQPLDTERRPLNLPRLQRMVWGPPMEQPMAVTIELDAYRFREVDAK
ncbi:MAG: Amuc_1100 family pilus-like protein [Verrucomicrobia bacterium]|nr:Amuc_1100 family pilus-like protein [Verrucomicrobiota bacterium]